ncbi:MAG: hypothetical protein K2X81_24830 [Candidatus Obscuribacterales bacterium]|nr:hypothetical protein [Candidatus Obscuribacterales bacterium]
MERIILYGIGVVVVLSIVALVFDTFFCMHCKKFSVRRKWYGPAFIAERNPKPGAPDIVYEVRQLVEECMCCHRQHKPPLARMPSSKEKADAYYASHPRKPNTLDSNF